MDTLATAAGVHSDQGVGKRTGWDTWHQLSKIPEQDIIHPQVLVCSSMVEPAAEVKTATTGHLPFEI